MQALEVARQEYEALDPRPRFTDAPKQPSAAERKLQVVTHLPFRAWCAFCVQTNSRGYHKYRSTPDGRATIQVGLFAMPNYMGVLLMVDVWTKYVGVEPLRNKNAGVIGTILARFLSNLSYFDAVEVSYDNEPVLSAGVNMTEVIRSNQGLPMTPQPGKKSRTGLAERTIQTVRAQGKCLVAFLEDKMHEDSRGSCVAWMGNDSCWLVAESLSSDFRKRCDCLHGCARTSLQRSRLCTWRRSLHLGFSAKNLSMSMEKKMLDDKG